MVTYKNVHYLTTRNKVYYFQRRIPKDVQHYYSIRTIACSLKTTSLPRAVKASAKLASLLDDYWITLRIDNLALKHCIAKEQEAHRRSAGLNLTDAKAIYCKLKGAGKQESFFYNASLCTNYAIQALGDKDLYDYSAVDGGKYRDWLQQKGLAPSSVKRVFSTTRAMINLAISEEGLDMKNPFSKVYFPALDNRRTKKSIQIEHIATLQNQSRIIKDPAYLLLSLISDTGMRLSEAAGLSMDELVLGTIHPYIDLQVNTARRLKTSKSTRKIPLVGESLWAAQQAKREQTGKYLFPTFIKDGKCRSNYTANLLNKKIKKVASSSVSVHSLRHSMRDRLRAQECPSEIIDAIGGWCRPGVGESYGDGYPIEVLYTWMGRLVISPNHDESFLTV